MVFLSEVVLNVGIDVGLFYLMLFSGIVEKNSFPKLEQFQQKVQFSLFSIHI